MEHLKHLENCHNEKRRRLQIREEQQARSGHSTEPAILIEVEDLKKDLDALDKEKAAHSKLLELFKQYENGFAHLLHQLGNHPRRKDALEYQQRMSANIERVRESGDSPSDSAEREWLIEQINTLAKQTLNTNFNHLKRQPARGTTGRPPSSPPSSAQSARSASAGTSSITSIQTQNNVTGDHNIINNASYQNIYHGPVGSVSDDSE